MTETTNPQPAIEVWARMLCAADVHVYGADHPNWQQLTTVIQDDYRKAARWLLPRLTITAPAAATAPASAPAGRAELRDRIAEALEQADYRPDMRRGDLADAIMPVLPPPADRAAILREAAEIAEGLRRFEPATGARKSAQVSENVGILRVADELRRVADEAQQPETQAAARETVEYFLQAQQDDGTWEDASSFMNAPDWAAERLAAKRARHPGFLWRMAQRTTTVAVSPLPDCLACRHWRCNGDGPCGALVTASERCTCPGPAAVSQPGKEA